MLQRRERHFFLGRLLLLHAFTLLLQALRAGVQLRVFDFSLIHSVLGSDLHVLLLDLLLKLCGLLAGR